MATKAGKTAERLRRDRGKRVYRQGTPRRVICPVCFEEFPVEQMEFSSHEGGDMPAAAKYTVWDKLAHLVLARRWKIRVPVDADGNRMMRKFCPEGHELPPNADLQETLIIGLIGAVASGKATYPAALVDRLNGEAGADIEALLVTVTDDTSQRYKKGFYDPLFTMKKTLPKTMGTPPPLIYDFKILGTPRGEENERSVNLALYYTEGEYLYRVEAMQRSVRYLLRASGIMLLVDPLGIPEVSGALGKNPGRWHLGPTPNETIANVLRTLELAGVVEQNGPLCVPLAVVFTKCDVLRDAGIIKEDQFWSTGERRHVGCFDMELHNETSNIMGECMRQWDGATYQTIRQRFPKHAFFGVSSTGCSPDTTGRYPFISPWRVEEPLLWILAELGVVPIKDDDEQRLGRRDS